LETVRKKIGVEQLPSNFRRFLIHLKFLKVTHCRWNYDVIRVYIFTSITQLRVVKIPTIF